jgi:hypothetical protein
VAPSAVQSSNPMCQGKLNCVRFPSILQIAKIRIESRDLPVFATDNQSNAFGTEIAGFIGIRTLSQMKLTIDYRDGLINLEVYEFKKARE